jgi:hypothetical protein
MATPSVEALELLPTATALRVPRPLEFAELPTKVLQCPVVKPEPALVPTEVFWHPDCSILKAPEPIAILFLDEISLKLIVAAEIIEDTGLFKQTVVVPDIPVTLNVPNKESSLLDETYTQLPTTNP